MRNRLTDLIVDALRDVRARHGLEALARVCADPLALDATGPSPERFPADLFERRGHGLRLKAGWDEHAKEFGERAGRAWRALKDRPLDAADSPLDSVLAAAATLFDAGLYFEVHEVLEPHWMRAEGADREALQGLIQIAVGFQHLLNRNVSGAQALLRDGCAKIHGQAVAGIELDAFAQAVGGCLERVLALGEDAPAVFDWSTVPRFPARR